ncbi:MAG: hypothetical protein H5U33_25575 [Pseudomonas sp.]|nr:hypothetical protein [Pseudomonas sp.]
MGASSVCGANKQDADLASHHEVFADSDLAACIREANRLNTERGYRNGVCVVELADGQRMTAADCKAAA